MNKRELVAQFEKLGFQPKHRLGQNFLVDPNLSGKLVQYAELVPTDTVVEVGPGMGMITREILKNGVNFVAVERDPVLKEFLSESLSSEFEGTFSIQLGDAVDLPLGGVEHADECKVIANPPFSITGPWLAKILDRGFPICFSLLLQKEAVERLTAKDGSKLFGTLAIRLAAAYERVETRPVPPQCFYPAPKIDSMIVVFRRKDEPHRFDPRMLEIIQTLFTQRRKQVGGRIRKLVSEGNFHMWTSILEENGLSLQARPEQIPTHIWVGLDKQIVWN